MVLAFRNTDGSWIRSSKQTPDVEQTLTPNTTRKVEPDMYTIREKIYERITRETQTPNKDEALSKAETWAASKFVAAGYNVEVLEDGLVIWPVQK